MSSLFDDLLETPPEPQEHACIECANFAGKARDKQAVLFRIGKGYCNSDDWHPAGKWVVIQNITRPKHCKAFVAASPNTVNERRKALEYFRVS